MESKLKGLTMMPAKAVKNDALKSYEYEYPDGWAVEIDRSEEFPEQILIKVRRPSPSFHVVSEMLVWAK